MLNGKGMIKKKRLRANTFLNLMNLFVETLTLKSIYLIMQRKLI